MIVLVYQVPKKAAPRVPVCQLFSCCTRLAGALGTECESCLGSLSDQEDDWLDEGVTGQRECLSPGLAGQGPPPLHPGGTDSIHWANRSGRALKSNGLLLNKVLL